MAEKEMRNFAIRDKKGNENGLEATKIIRQRWHQNSKIIIITAYTNYHAACIDAGADDFMTKPLVIENLKGTINCSMPTPSFMQSKFERTTATSDPRKTEYVNLMRQSILNLSRLATS